MNIAPFFEPVVRDAPIPVVANQRRPQKSRIAMIAAAVDAERHAESPVRVRRASHRAAGNIARRKFPSAARASAVRVRGAEYVAAHGIDAREAVADDRRVAGPSIAPCDFANEQDAGRRFSPLSLSCRAVARMSSPEYPVVRSTSAAMVFCPRAGAAANRDERDAEGRPK